MARHDHHWGFASEVGQCRRGKACEASPINREGYPPKLTAEAMRRQANGPLSPTAHLCSACRLCIDCAPQECKARSARGGAGDALSEAGAPRPIATTELAPGPDASAPLPSLVGAA